jgi:hypothetical protein
MKILVNINKYLPQKVLIGSSFWKFHFFGLEYYALISNLYRGLADCENRIKELKADFVLDSFVLRDIWATEAG